MIYARLYHCFVLFVTFFKKIFFLFSMSENLEEQEFASYNLSSEEWYKFFIGLNEITFHLSLCDIHNCSFLKVEKISRCPRISRYF